MVQKATRSRAASHISRLLVSGPLRPLPVGLGGPLGHVGHHLPTWSITFLRGAQCAGLEDVSARGGVAVEEAGGCPC